jgi:hypothetical protein
MTGCGNLGVVQTGTTGYPLGVGGPAPGREAWGNRDTPDRVLLSRLFASDLDAARQIAEH